MSEEILSQEEIDALLTAVDDGDVSVEAEGAEQASAVEAYDLTTQSIMLRDQFSGLEQMYDKFSAMLNNYFSAKLQKQIEAKYVSTEMVKYVDFIKAFSNPTSFNVFSMEPLIGSSMLVLESDLVFSMIDCLFGGDGKPLAQQREFTLIEKRMITKVVEEVLVCFEKAWAIFFDINIAIKSHETKPDFVNLVAPNNLVIVMCFSINGKEFSGNFHVCISYLMIEPVKNQLSALYMVEKGIENTWRSKLQRLLKDTMLNVVGEIGRKPYTVRDVLNFKEGDIIKLNSGTHDPTIVKVEGVPKYLGFPGIAKGNRAVQISDLITQNKRGC